MTSRLSKLSYGSAAFSCMGVLALCCAVLWAASFTDTGLRWWLELNHLPALCLMWMFAALGVMLIFAMWAVSESFGQGLCMGVVGSLLGLLMCISFGDTLGKWDWVHAGPVSVYRAVALQGEVFTASPGDVSLTRWKASLHSPTHARLRAAFLTIEPTMADAKLQRVLDASALLGLDDNPVIVRAKARGAIKERDFHNLRLAARARAAHDPALSHWSALQQAAFLALTQENGLDQPLQIKELSK